MKNNQQGFTVIEAIVSLFVIGLLACMVGLFVVMFTGLHIDTGHGEHTGFVTAVEKEGLIFKTGRAYFKTDASSSQEDQYCVSDDNVYQQLEQAAKDKKQLTILHRSYFATAVNECKSEDAIIYGVK